MYVSSFCLHLSLLWFPPKCNCRSGWFSTTEASWPSYIAAWIPYVSTDCSFTTGLSDFRFHHEKVVHRGEHGPVKSRRAPSKEFLRMQDIPRWLAVHACAQSKERNIPLPRPARVVRRCPGLPTDGNHDVQIFDTLLEGEFMDETRLPPPRPRCIKPVPFYKGLEALQVPDREAGRKKGEREAPC